MEIILTKKFRKYAKEKNITTIAVKYGQSCTTWAGSFKVPSVLKEKPKDVFKYRYNLIDGIEVYVHKSVKTTEKNILELNVIGFLILKEVEVKGMDLKI